MTLSKELKAYVTPNPVLGNAKLIIATSLDLPINFQLVDILGRTYRSTKMSLKGSNSINFSVGDLQPGSYIILLKQGSFGTQARFVVMGK